MCIDIRYFILILSVFIFGAGNAFFLLFAGCEEEGCDDGWSTPGTTVYSTFNMLILGDFDGDALDATVGPAVAMYLGRISKCT